MEILFNIILIVLLLTLLFISNKVCGLKKELFIYHISLLQIGKTLLCECILQSPKTYILRFALLPWDQRISRCENFKCSLNIALRMYCNMHNIMVHFYGTNITNSLIRIYLVWYGMACRYLPNLKAPRLYFFLFAPAVPLTPFKTSTEAKS